MKQILKTMGVLLNNGMRMPQLGVGTFTLKETAARDVKHALSLGYRLVDCAQGYQNEAEVWQGIKESGVNRNERTYEKNDPDNFPW